MNTYEERRGNCYQLAYQMLMAAPDHFSPVLVHGFPTGTGGEAKGHLYGHAWVEVTIGDRVLVLDPIRIDLGPVDRHVYYMAGSIKTSQCRRYTIKQALRMADKHEHYGAWHTVPGATYAWDHTQKQEVSDES